MLRLDEPITTPRLTLRLFEEGDLDALYDIHRRPEVFRYLYGEPLSHEETRAKLGEKIARSAISEPGQALALAVELRETGELVGDCLLSWADGPHHQGEIGYIFHPLHAGRGLATEGVRELLGLGFDVLELHRLYGQCDGRNTASVRLMERLGMRREAHLRENEFVKGEWTDEVICAMLRREWRHVWRREERAQPTSAAST